MDPITWVLVGTNAATAAAIVKMRRCRHEWGSWSGWTAIEKPMRTVRFIRFRSCVKCGKLQKMTTGKHLCFGSKCQHLAPFIVAMDDEARRIKRMEKELGL